MKKEEIKELHKIVQDYFLERGYEIKDALAFLSITFVGTMAMHGFSDEFFDKTVEIMKVQFREKKKGNNDSKM